jgi:hypothetical protein
MKAEIEQFAQTNQPESDCKCWFDSKRRILSSDCSVHNQPVKEQEERTIYIEKFLATKQVVKDSLTTKKQRR